MLTVRWHKSRHSGANGQCLEASFQKSSYSGWNGCLEAAWNKSSYSASNGCVEGSLAHGTVLIRDSKLGDAGPVAEFTPQAWQAFISTIKTA